MTVRREMALVFNGLRFVRRNSRLGETISNGREEHPVHGMYQQDENGIHLFRPSGELEAYLVANRRQGYFAVSASGRDSGARVYMQSTSSLTEKWLGIEGLGHAESIEVVRRLKFEDVVMGAEEKALAA